MGKDLEAQINALDSRLAGMPSRSSTFVSVDMVDSTGIKIGEAEEDVIFSFLAYQKMVEAIVLAHAGEVVSITGDGVMARFSQGGNAIQTAVDIFGRLAHFNQTVNLLKSPFHVRIGINTGKVFEDSSELRTNCQLLPSPAIDIAGYLQKRAPVNGMLISQFTIEQLDHPIAGVRKDHYDEKLGFMIYGCQAGGAAQAIFTPKTKVSRMLVVEDEPDQAYELAKIFQEAGYEIDIAFDGVDGLAHFKAFEPHLMLLDISLSRLDGWQVLDALRGSKLTPRIPVLMLSRRYKVGDIERSLEMGASGCVRKPCDKSRLLRKVQALLA